MLNRSASLAMSTCVLKALPGKLDIKRHSPSILYIVYCLAHCSMITKVTVNVTTVYNTKNIRSRIFARSLHSELISSSISFAVKDSLTVSKSVLCHCGLLLTSFPVETKPLTFVVNGGERWKPDAFLEGLFLAS